ncbi:MAG: DUF5052 family protein [Clostridia bacterium]
MKKTNFVRHLGIILCLCLLLTSLTGCAWFSNEMKNIKGELIGNHFSIDFYDNFGNKVVTMEGEKVGMEANYVKSKSVNSEGTTSTNYEQSSVITMTIDGNQVAQTGNTVIFAEDGIKKLDDFNLPSDITTNGDGTINIFDRNINKIKNLLGTPKVIVVCSQLGVPIAVYGGENVYWEIPDDLPKTTKLNVDGLALYIHRANYILLDSEMIK